MTKDQFHRKAKKTLKDLAARLGLAPGSFEVRSNKAGPAVLGEVVLHSESLYVMVGIIDNMNGVLYRSCKGRKDYCGGHNNYMAFDKILEVESLNRLRAIGSISHATCTKEIAEAFGFDKLPAHLVTIK